MSELRESLFTLYFTRASALGMGEVTSDNWNLRNLNFNEKNLSRDVGINKIGICSNYIQLP